MEILVAQKTNTKNQYWVDITKFDGFDDFKEIVLEDLKLDDFDDVFVIDVEYPVHFIVDDKTQTLKPWAFEFTKLQDYEQWQLAAYWEVFGVGDEFETDYRLMNERFEGFFENEWDYLEMRLIQDIGEDAYNEVKGMLDWNKVERAFRYQINAYEGYYFKY